MKDTIEDIKRQEKIQSLTPRFWKSTGLTIQSVLGMKDRIGSPKKQQETLLPSAKGRKIALHTIGDIISPDDRNVRLCSIIDKENGTLLMRYCERNTSWDNDGKTRPENHINRVGPAEYYYPDGRLAALEMYDEKFDFHYKDGRIKNLYLYDDAGNRLDHFDLLDQDGRPIDIGETLNDANGNIVPVEDYDRLTSVYFDKEGNSITQAEFDVIYMKEMDALGLHAGNASLSEAEHYEYAPRIRQYYGLVKDLHMEMTVGGDRFSPQDIRELHLANKPESYLNMLSEDILKEHHSYPGWERMGSDDFIRKQIEMFVYGQFPKAKEYAVQNIENYIKKNGINTDNILETKPIKGLTFNDGLIHTTKGNQDGAMLCELGYKDGPIKSRYLQKSITDEDTGMRIHVYDGPYVEFYPDGKLASCINYQYDNGMHPTESYPEYTSFYDKNGRLTSFPIFSKDFENAWNEYEKKNSMEVAPKEQTEGRNVVELSGMVVSCKVNDSKRDDSKAFVHLEICTSSGTERDEKGHAVLKNPMYHRVMTVVDKPVPEQITRLQQETEDIIRMWKTGIKEQAHPTYLSVEGVLVSHPMKKDIDPYVLANPENINFADKALMKNTINLEGQVVDTFANPVYATMVIKSNTPNGIDTYIEVSLKENDNKKKYNDIYNGKVKKGDIVSIKGMLKSQHLTGGGKESFICTVATDNFTNKTQIKKQKKNKGISI